MTFIPNRIRMLDFKPIFLPKLMMNSLGKYILSSAIALGAIIPSGKAQIGTKDLTGKLANELNAITTMVPFLTITPDSRSAAMGDVGVALFRPDANSVSWNMSNLVFANEKTGFSLSYAPWLRQIVDDVGFSYLSGYSKMGDNVAIGGSFRYFSLGNIQFTDIDGNATGNFNPNEFSLDGGVAIKLNKNFAWGVNLRFIYSNLTGNRAIGGIDYKAALGGAGDINFTYKTEIKNGNKYDKLKAGINIQNIGSKMTYSSREKLDFIPTNLKLGVGYTTDIDDYNKISIYADINKLLVPTRPYYVQKWDGGDSVSSTGDRILLAGRDPNVNVVQGMAQSFYDAPGGMKEELNEYMLSGGMEYTYNDQFTIRGGVFYEAREKGGRQYGTLGFGIKYQTITIDAAYLVPFVRRHPLQNQMRFSFLFDLGALSDK